MMTTLKRKERDKTSGKINVKRKTKRISELVGCLTARSHLLHSEPECIIIEICSAHSAHYILCTPNQLSMNYLNIGQCYKFMNLLRGSVVLKGSTVECFKLTCDTVVEEVNCGVRIYDPPHLENFTVIKGEVTDVNCELGICYLNRSNMVIFSTCSRVACLPIPTKEQTVTIFNVHRLKKEDNQTIYAMCVKSFMRIEGEDERKIPQPQLSPLLLSLGDAVRDYRLILWLQKCSIFLQNIFSDDFLLLYGIAKNQCKEFRSCLLQNVAKFILKQIKVERTSTLEEFMATDHKFRCGVLKEVMLPFQLRGLQQINEKYPDLEDEVNEEGDNVFWQYDVKKDTVNILIGVISLKSSNFRLTLNDASCSTPCLVFCNDNIEKLAKLQKKIVVVMEHNLIRERFSIPGENPPYQNLRYLLLSLDKVHIISAVDTNWKNSNLDDMHITRQPGGSDSQSAGLALNITEPNTSGGKRNMETIFMPSYSPAGKEKALRNYFSQFVLVQTKSSIVLRKDKVLPRCYLLVSLLGEMVKSATVPRSSHRNHSNKFIFINLENPLLKIIPFVTVNSVLEIRFPVDFDDNFFKKGLPLRFVEGLITMLPTICSVTLPPSAEVHLIIKPTDNLKFRDCFGIQQSLDEANYKELIDVMGYVVGRYHQDPRYEREKTNLKVNGFGVPGSKVIAVVVRDTPPESQTGTPVTLYMSNASSPMSVLQYPFGLVPGAKVICRRVVKVKPSSKASGVYFRSSLLTSVEIIDVVKSERNNEEEGMKDLWGLRGLLHSAQSAGNLGCTWITVSMASLIKFSINATCAACKHPVKKKVCTFRGCSASVGCTIYSQATILVNEFEAKPAYVFVPDNLVSKLLEDCEGLWENVITLAQFNGQLEYSQSKSFQGTLELLSLEERVFRQLCRCILKGKRFHLLCRQFRNKVDEKKYEDTSALYAVDISPISMVMAAS